MMERRAMPVVNAMQEQGLSSTVCFRAKESDGSRKLSSDCVSRCR